MTFKHIVKITLAIVLSFFCNGTNAQMQYLNNDDNGLHFIDRLNHLHNSDSLQHFSIRDYRRNDIKRMALNNSAENLNAVDQKSLSHINNTLYFGSDYNVLEQKGLWNTFYKNKAHFFEVKEADFNLTINPILNLQFGKDFENQNNVFLNQRGIELWGELDQKLYFYTSFYENQSNFFNYINPYIDQYKSIPGQGNYKDFSSSLFNIDNAFDYSNAQAYLGYKISKHSLLEIGHGRHFIGNGERSLLLSDFSNNYFYLKFAFRVWKLHYQSIFAELNSGSSKFTAGDNLLPKKYKATHYLSFKASPKFEIGFFETVVFSREDHFEFQYLNPVILYRTVEFFLDSPDNVLLGLNLNYMAFNKTSVYGQLVLDELRTSEVFSGNGWWGNKFGYQIGLKHFDLLGINNLDILAEFNSVRPYTYSHNSISEAFPNLSSSSYSHNNQALAHPLGSNFSEFILKLRYQPMHKLVLDCRFIYSTVGKSTGENNGSDILINNSSREMNFDNSLHQGAKSTINHLDVSVSYELFHSLFIDGFFKLRTDNNEVFENINTTFIGSGFRYNISNRKVDY